MAIRIDDPELERLLTILGAHQDPAVSKTKLARAILDAGIRAADESGDPAAWAKYQPIER